MRGGYIVERGTHEGIYIFSSDRDHYTRHGLETNVFLAPAKATWSKKQKQCERVRRRSISAKNELVNCEESDWAELLFCLTLLVFSNPASASAEACASSSRSY